MEVGKSKSNSKSVFFDTINQKYIDQNSLQKNLSEKLQLIAFERAESINDTCSRGPALTRLWCNLTLPSPA